MTEPVAFRLPESVQVADLERCLLHELVLAGPTEGRIQRTWYDTFDWRLYEAGLVLEHERAGDEVVGPKGFLRVRPLGRLVPMAETPIEAVPRRPADVADPRVRDRLTRPVSTRALVAVATSDARTRIYRRLDDQDKAVVRVILTQDVVVPASGGPGTELGPWVMVAPVRGYDEELFRTIEQIRHLTGGTPADDPMLVAARAVGLEPGVDPSAFAVTVRPDATAGEALRLLLGRLVHVMAANEAGVRAELDSEFLHDYRVAVRRARSLVQASEDVMPEAERVWLAGELRWLGRLTTPPRDLDVTMEDLDQPGSLLEEHHEALEPLREVLARWRAEAQAELVEALDSERYRTFLASTASLLGARWGPGDLSAVELAQRRIRSAHRRVMRLGEKAESPEDWHEVRKAAKRLRYLLEGFRTVLPKGEVGEAITFLKRFQEVLGAMQDAVVHGEAARRAVPVLVAAEAPAETFVAAGALIQHYAERGHEAYEHCAERFEAFAAKPSRRHFKRLWTAPAPTMVHPGVDEHAQPHAAPAPGPAALPVVSQVAASPARPLVGPRDPQPAS